MKPLPVGGGVVVNGCVAVDEGDDERVAVGMPFELVVNWISDDWVTRLIRVRVLLSMVDVVVSVKGVGAQPHPVITVIVVPELEVYGGLEQ